jgi:predicted Zn-dependent peptidase
VNVALSNLDNGLRVVAATLPHVDSVAVGIWVHTGSRHEPARLAGASHFIEHLLFKGTRRRTPHQISTDIEGCGGYLDAFTQEEDTCYYARVAREHADLALDVLCDMYLHPRLAQEDIAKERSVILDEIQMYRDQPQHVVQEMLSAALWSGHPLGRPVPGTEASLNRMTRADLAVFKSRCYVPRNTVVAAAGNITLDECAAMVRRRLGRVPAGAPPRRQATGAGARQQPLAFQARDVEQAHIALGFRHFGRHDPRRHALRLLNVVLGENMSSRLFQVLRETHGLAYAVQSSFTMFEETGAWGVTAGVEAGRIARSAKLIGRELRRLRDHPVPEKELRQAKDYVIGQMKLGLESTSQQMMWIGEQFLTFGRFISPERMAANLARVDASQMQQVARAVLREDRLSLSIVAPNITERELRQVRQQLV